MSMEMDGLAFGASLKWPFEKQQFLRLPGQLHSSERSLPLAEYQHLDQTGNLTAWKVASGQRQADFVH